MNLNELNELLSEKEKTYELIFTTGEHDYGIDELIDADNGLVTLASEIT